MNYYNTYSDLAQLVNNIFNESKIYLDSKKSKILIDIIRDYNDEIRFLIGVIFFEIDEKNAIQIFRSNRYFIDAIGISLLPNIESIQKLTGLSIEGVMISDYVKKIINESLVKKIKNNDKEIKKNISKSELDFLDTEGYLIIENAIPLEKCDELYDKIINISKKESNSPKGGYVYGSGNMQRIYHLIAKDQMFRDLITNNHCHEIMRYMFHRDNFHDKYYLTSFHSNILYQSAEPQIWHIDANVPEPIPQWIIRSNSNFIIQDYFKDNGATEIIPRSHKYFKKPNINEIDSNQFESKFIEAPKGSIVFWHGHLWHRSGQNKTNKARVALLGAYAASFFREVSMEENPYCTKPRLDERELTPKIKQLLGWDHGLKDYC